MSVSEKTSAAIRIRPAWDERASPLSPMTSSATPPPIGSQTRKLRRYVVSTGSYLSQMSQPSNIVRPIIIEKA